jgi:hypothetical protein
MAAIPNRHLSIIEAGRSDAPPTDPFEQGADQPTLCFVVLVVVDPINDQAELIDDLSLAVRGVVHVKIVGPAT